MARWIRIEWRLLLCPSFDLKSLHGGSEVWAQNSGGESGVESAGRSLRRRSTTASSVSANLPFGRSKRHVA